MKTDRKELLKRAFEAPAPVRKQEFIRKMPQTEPGRYKLWLVQAEYISKWVWGISAALFFISLIGARILERDMLWVISAFLPFVALSAVTENTRSVVYGMAELEMAARFSLKSILLVRMGILGSFHLCLLCFLIPFGQQNSTVTLLQAGVYMLVPYLLTIAAGLWIVKRVRGRDSVYGCLGAAAAVSAAEGILHSAAGVLFENSFLFWWMAILLILTVLTAAQYGKMICQAEELVRNGG